VEAELVPTRTPPIWRVVKRVRFRLERTCGQRILVAVDSVAHLPQGACRNSFSFSRLMGTRTSGKIISVRMEGDRRHDQLKERTAPFGLCARLAIEFRKHHLLVSQLQLNVEGFSEFAPKPVYGSVPTVDDFVAVRAIKDQSHSTRSQSAAATRSISNVCDLRNSVEFNNCRNLVRDQGVGGSNPLSPTIFSLALSIVYAATTVSLFSVHFGTLGITEGNSMPKLHCSAHFLRKARSSLILS
jgi:hypothetical protein